MAELRHVTTVTKTAVVSLKVMHAERGLVYSTLTAPWHLAPLEPSVDQQMVRGLPTHMALAKEVVLVVGGGELLRKDGELERSEVGLCASLVARDVNDVAACDEAAGSNQRQWAANSVRQRWRTGNTGALATLGQHLRRVGLHHMYVW